MNEERNIAMKILGLDIGSTTVSAVVVEDGNVLSALTLKNGSFIDTGKPWEKIQDPAYIRTTALQAVQELLEQHPDVARIGITGQMHGIVYLNAAGEPVSPPVYMAGWPGRSKNGKRRDLCRGAEPYHWLCCGHRLRSGDPLLQFEKRPGAGGCVGFLYHS